LGRLDHSDVLKHMAVADVYIQHSVTDPETGDQEGAPVAIMEAMANGLPIVSTRHSGIPFLVEEGVSGLLSEESDVSAMALNISTLAAKFEMRRQMGQSARSRAKAFSWESEKKELLKILQIQNIK
jgi:colanic acid/amylovoran biosynthesis glycosyltransferase